MSNSGPIKSDESNLGTHRGLYLVEPHGRLIAENRKTLIAKSKHLPLEGDWLLLSKDNGRGLEYGKITVGQPRVVTIEKFDSLFKYHRVTPKERSRWWPTKIELYLYPITELVPHEKPNLVEIPAGTQTIVEKIKYVSTPSERAPSESESEPSEPKSKPIKDPGQDRERPYSEVGAPRASDTHSDPAEKASKPEPEPEHKETTMPWTVANPPSCAKNWTTAEKAKCVKAANAALKGGAEEQDAIFACIRAAGKTKHPGGKKAQESTESTESTNGFLTLQSYLEGLGLDEIMVKAQSDQVSTQVSTQDDTKARGAGQGVGGPKQGEGPPDLCHCPKCGHEIKHVPGEPCTDTKCPKCGTPMKGKDAKNDEKPKPETKQAITKPKPSDMLYEPSGSTKGGRRLQSSKLEFLGSLKGKLESLLKDLGELIGWAAYDDKKPIMFQGQSGFKALKAQDGQTHLLTWTMNAFKDREHEIFTLKSIEDYVARNAGSATKGTFDFWHLPGTDFGKITWQGVVGRFLVESGPFDDTPIGHQAEKFFLAHAKGHSGIAPEGWGTSHAYVYKESDKQHGVYTWFDKRKTTVLPRSAAANIFNPELEVTIMDQKQKDALTEIWGVETASQIIKLGESKTKDLEQAGVATKENTESPDTENPDSGKSQEGESQETKGETETKPTDVKPETEVKEIVTNVADELQLGALSDAFKALGDAVSNLGEQVQGIHTRLDALEVTDEKKLAEKEQSLPRYSWFRASQAAETVLGENDALKSARPQVPEAISRLSGTE